MYKKTHVTSDRIGNVVHNIFKAIRERARDVPITVTCVPLWSISKANYQHLMRLKYYSECKDIENHPDEVPPAAHRSSSFRDGDDPSKIATPQNRRV